jgi:AcrR family transcriptional regulator
LPRKNRTETQADTRARLLAAAHDMFRREGYAATSVARIADAAGYSKGALYSNFENKEAIFLAVLDAQGQQGLDALIAAIAEARDVPALVDLLAGWADERSLSGGWSLAILEHARLAGPDALSLAHQKDIVRGHWLQLGRQVRLPVPGLEADEETLGALLHEIAYAPALTFMAQPTAGAIMRLVMRSLLGLAA